MNTTPYGHDYFPPAPGIRVNIAVPYETAQSTLHSALIDTGADGTFVPTAILEELEIPVEYMINVRSHLGERLHHVPVHKVDIILFGSTRLPSIDVVSDDWGDQIIIGRNVLNKLQLHLDGPSEETHVKE